MSGSSTPTRDRARAQASAPTGTPRWRRKGQRAEHGSRWPATSAWPRAPPDRPSPTISGRARPYSPPTRSTCSPRTHSGTPWRPTRGRSSVYASSQGTPTTHPRESGPSERRTAPSSHTSASAGTSDGHMDTGSSRPLARLSSCEKCPQKGTSPKARRRPGNSPSSTASRTSRRAGSVTTPLRPARVRRGKPP